MMSTTPNSRPTMRHRRAANRRPPSPSSSAVSPSPVDRRRWEDLSSGISPEELAARENVRLPTILKSRDTMRTYLARYSQAATETEVRRLFVEALPDAARVFSEGMQATETIHKQVVRERMNARTGEIEEYVDEEVTIVPDHATRAKFLSELTKLNQSIQPKSPLLAIDARSQTNNLNQLGAGAATAGALSFESITRQIRAERGLSLGPGDPSPTISSPATLAPIEVDYELQEELAEETGSDNDSDGISSATILDTAAEAS